MNSTFGADEVRDRGQILLIAAIAIAFIVLGLVVVFNGVLYSNTVASGEANEGMADVEQTELEIEQGVKEIIESSTESGDPGWWCEGVGGGANCLGNDVGDMEHVYGQSKANERSTSLSIEVDSVTNPHSDPDATVDLTYTYVTESINITRSIEIEVGDYA